MEQNETTRHRFGLILHGGLDRAVLAVDRSLRRATGIFEFCEERECILRIAVVESDAYLVLPDGTEICPHDPVIDLHFWNEHLPSLGQAGASLAWGGMFRARMRSSLRMLAEHMAADSVVAGVRACRAKPAFLRDRRIRRTAYRLGFVEAVPEASLSEQVHEFLQTFLIYGLTWVFNPDALPEKACWPQRSYLWMSRKELFRRYGSQGNGRAIPALASCDEAAAGN